MLIARYDVVALNRCTIRLPSIPEQTTRECVQVVRGGHFRKGHKDGDHNTRFATAENPMLHAKFTALSSTAPDISPIKFYIAKN